MLVELDDVLDFIYDEATRAAKHEAGLRLLIMRYGWNKEPYESQYKFYQGRYEACSYLLKKLIAYGEEATAAEVEQVIPGQLTLRGALREPLVKGPEFREGSLA